MEIGKIIDSVIITCILLVIIIGTFFILEEREISKLHNNFCPEENSITSGNVNYCKGVPYVCSNSYLAINFKCEWVKGLGGS